MRSPKSARSTSTSGPRTRRSTRPSRPLPEGDGTVWDHTLIVHWNELAQGDSHAINDSLVILAGGANGYFRRGRYLDFANQASFADMLVSCFHYMGFDDVTSFGDPVLQLKGALTGLT